LSVILFVIIPIIVVLVLMTVVYNRWRAKMVVTLLAACHCLNLFMYCVLLLIWRIKFSLSLWLSPMLEHGRNVTGFTSHTASSRRRLTTSDYWLSVGAEPYHQWP